MTQWLLAIDLDGTVLHEDETFDPELGRLLQQLDAREDTEIIVATGRSLGATLPVVAELGIRGNWVICCNGAVTVKKSAATGEYEYDAVHTFDPAPLLQRVHHEIPGAIIAVEGGDGHFYYTDEIPSKTLPTGRTKVEFPELLQIPATRVVAIAPDKSVAEFFEHTAELGLNHVSYAVGPIAWIDAAPEGVTKASALEPLRELLQIPAGHVFAAGDGNNDIQMLEWGAEHGTSYAMGQGGSAVKEAATRTTLSIEDGGLTAALRDWAGRHGLL